MSERERLAGLARLIATEIDKAPRRPRLRLIRREDLAKDVPPDDPVMREHRIARIHWISRHYGLDVIVRQHTFGRAGIDALEAPELIKLHSEIERALQCVLDGFPIDEAGFVRHQGE